MLLAIIFQLADQPAVSAGTNDKVALIGSTLGLVAAAAYAAWLKFKPDKVDAAGKDLDVSALSAGSAMIAALQQDIARLREQQSLNEKKWQEDMQRLQDRLDAMSMQVEQAIAARRVAEENAAQLRLQVRSLGAA